MFEMVKYESKVINISNISTLQWNIQVFPKLHAKTLSLKSAVSQGLLKLTVEGEQIYQLNLTKIINCNQYAILIG